MDKKKEKLVIDGNAFYEVDLDCLEQKRRVKEAAEKKRQQKRQRK
ncbi:MAG: hypothetical protein Q4D16_06805 [Eubacteriales bacterium]|nr:hypothetical protein [Eubacteriales bacterium]